MHAPVFYAAVVWLMVLIGLLAVHAARARTLADRALALDTLALLFIAELALYASFRAQTGYLDVAMMLALLAFTQTVATVQYALHGRAIP